MLMANILTEIGCKRQYVACDVTLKEIARSTSLAGAIEVFGRGFMSVGWVWLVDETERKLEGYLVDNGKVVEHNVYAE